MRQYPELPLSSKRPEKAISFVVVKFSDEYYHNFKTSDCLKDHDVELVLIDNTANLYFDNLTSAMTEGIAKTTHELIAVVHEDVVLPKGWRLSLESSLQALERHDSSWGVLGSVGWNIRGEVAGHLSDPHGYTNTFTIKPYEVVERLDEQILIFHRDRILELDQKLPSIHNIGKDVILTLQKTGMKSYAINAPTIHKYADQSGKLILSKNDSPKINERETLRYKADREICDEYLFHKWSNLSKMDHRFLVAEPNLKYTSGFNLDEPIVLLARGGAGSRLLSTLALDLGLFIGNNTNESGDTLELAMPIYQGIIEKYQCKSRWQKQRTIPRLRSQASTMLSESENTSSIWGFKLPESILLLQEILVAFPRARVINMIRDPLTTCLRRTHMTARLDNVIGRISLSIAYDSLGRTRENILTDSPAVHMAITTIHQLNLTSRYLSMLSPNRFVRIRFEDLINHPSHTIENVGYWLGIPRVSKALERVINLDRANKSTTRYSPEVVNDVVSILKPIRKEYGYIN